MNAQLWRIVDSITAVSEDLAVRDQFNVREVMVEWLPRDQLLPPAVDANARAAISRIKNNIQYRREDSKVGKKKNNMTHPWILGYSSPPADTKIDKRHLIWRLRSYGCTSYLYILHLSSAIPRIRIHINGSTACCVSQQGQDIGKSTGTSIDKYIIVCIWL